VEIICYNEEFGFLFLNYPLLVLVTLLHLFQKSFFFSEKITKKTIWMGELI